MAAPRRAFVSSSGASGRPRSAKTLPLPCITRSTVFLAISLLIIPLCHLQPCMHHSNIGLAGLNSTRRLLLEGVQDIDGLLESDRVDSPVGITIVVADDFKNPRPLALPRLGGQVLTSKLSRAKRKTEVALNHRRKLPGLLQGGAHPVKRPFSRYIQPCHDYPTFGISCRERTPVEEWKEPPGPGIRTGGDHSWIDFSTCRAILPLPPRAAWRWRGFYRPLTVGLCVSGPSPCGNCPCLESWKLAACRKLASRPWEPGR